MIDQVLVVVPAANEEQRIAACLASIRRAAGVLPRTLNRPVIVHTVVVLDGCSDGTAKAVSRFAEVRAVTTDVRSVGLARQVGADALLQHSAVARPDIWLANTDADSIVPHDWLIRMVSAADQGADLFLGMVRPGPELVDASRAEWFARHTLQAGHPHVHGANLGIRASVLEQIGGWAPVSSGEDVELAQRAGRANAAIVRSADGVVQTSARSHGRAPAGFSSYLRAIISAGNASADKSRGLTRI